MSTPFFNLPDEQQIALLRQAEQQLNLAESVIEKDVWLCWLLEQVFSLPAPLCFKGGTSLSKAYRLIQRFSEDVDLTIDYRHFNPEIDFKQTSRSQLKKLSELFKAQLKEYLQNTLLPALQKRIRKVLPHKAISIQLSEDGESLHFYYPSVLAKSVDYLREHILLEFGMRNSVEPSERLTISPYLLELFPKGVTFPQPHVNVLSPVRSFWEKATLIHVECHRNRFNESPERLARHWYDLNMLALSPIGNQALHQRPILESVLQYKNAFFNASYAHYDECLTGRFKLIPDEVGQKKLSQDYRKMIEAGMFQTTPPSFVEILENLKALEQRINRIS